MKRLITTALIAATITGSAFAANFTDVPKDAWYASDLNSVLTDARMLVAGYPDGTFKPDMGFTVEQFAAIMVKASDVTEVPADASGDWAAPWVKKAKELGYIKDGEFTTTSRPITRGEMARIIIRYTEAREKNTYNDVAKVKKDIGDYDKISSTLQPYVVKVYDLGIIGGYPDGTFGADKSLKRSEAVAVVSKIVFSSKRLGNKINYAALQQVPVDEAIDLKQLSAQEKYWFKNATCYNATLEQVQMDLKFHSGSSETFSFKYNARRGLEPVYAIDSSGVYHLGFAGGYPIGNSTFDDDQGKQPLKGKSIEFLIFGGIGSNQYVIVPCHFEISK